MSSNAARAASAPKPRRRPERPAMNKERSFDRYEGAALVLPGFTAFGPEWPWRGGESAPPFRHLARRSGRIPAEPYPPARCCQYRPAGADRAPRICQSDLPEPTPARYNYPCPAKLPLAAFEVTLIGRFSSDPRGWIGGSCDWRASSISLRCASCWSACSDGCSAGQHADLARRRRDRSAARFTGLIGVVQTVLDQNPFSGHVFAFRGRRGDLIAHHVRVSSPQAGTETC